MFNTSHTLLLNKIDLLPHITYNMDEVMENIKNVNPKLNIFPISATTDEGMDKFIEYLEKRINEKKNS